MVTYEVANDRRHHRYPQRGHGNNKANNVSGNTILFCLENKSHSYRQYLETGTSRLHEQIHS